MPTFAEMDRMIATREAKRIELVDRLSELLGKAFDADELRFMWSYGPGTPSVILIESFERARR
jgi:hypothetical protein